MMTDVELDEIEAREKAACPGPWEDDGMFVDSCAPGGPLIVEAKGADEATMRFIAHARTDVPALVAEVRRLRAENERGVSMKTMTSCPRCGAYPFQHFLRWQVVRAFCWRRLIRKIWAILTNRLEEYHREVGDFAVICRGCKNIVGYED